MYLQWLVVANASFARIFALNSLSQSNMDLVHELHHPDSRKKIHELVSDKLGQHAQGSLIEQSNPHQLEMNHFAKQVAEKLIKACQQLPIAKLIIVSPAHFYGLITKHLNNQVLEKIKLVSQKDYTSLSEPQLKTLFFPKPQKMAITQ